MNLNGDHMIQLFKAIKESDRLQGAHFSNMTQHNDKNELFIELMTIIGINHYKIDCLNRERKANTIQA